MPNGKRVISLCDHSPAAEVRRARLGLILPAMRDAAPAATAFQGPYDRRRRLIPKIDHRSINLHQFLIALKL
jgi:hypothetical protein